MGVYDQGEFVRKFGGPEIIQKLTTKDGTSLVESMYENTKVMF